MILYACAFAAHAGLLSLAVTGHRHPLWVRLVYVTLTAWLAFAVYGAAQPPTGWPAHVTPPTGEFQWASIREPADGDAGEIDLWLIPRGMTQPRAYRLPYTRQLHKQVARAMEGAKHGAHTTVARRKRGQRGRFHFYRTPAVRLPTKGTP